MITEVYFVRHGESSKLEGNERTRELTAKGHTDAERVAELLSGLPVDVLLSSPYRRAVQTMEPLARRAGKEIFCHEGLRETVFAGEDRTLNDTELLPAVRRMLSDREYSLPGGESASAAQKRAVAALEQLFVEYQGQNLAIGTHGLIMTLIFQYYDSRYDWDFLMKTTKPDIYRMTLSGGKPVDLTRLWDR